MNRELLDKWLNGTLSPSELEVLKQDPAFADYRKIDAFVKRLDLPDASVSGGLEDIKQKIAKRETKVISIAPILKFVAAAAVIVLVGYFYIASLPTSFKTQLAATQTLDLPDQSRVTINENSQLSFVKSSWEEDRTMKLAGEAFFEVAKGKTFEVHTEHGIVTVLGTKFNVFSRGDRFKVVCYEGVVQVSHREFTEELTAGEAIAFSGDRFISETKHTTRPAWIYDESSFENTSIRWVLEELKSVYSINIITENIDVDLPYTGSFTNTNLDYALQTITLPLGLDYVIENKNVILFAKD